jgi:GLPGLI family protein
LNCEACFNLLLFVLMPFIGNCQATSGKVQYKLTINDDAVFDKGPDADFFKVAKESSHYLSYTLKFDTEKSVFSLDPIMDDRGNVAIAIAFSGISGKFYNIKSSKSLLNEIDDTDFGKIIIKSQYDNQWNFSNESKVIDGFECFKASRVIIVDNGTFGVFKRTIFAWYCPEIPVPFGPAGEGGLPGLILELQNRNVIFGVMKINLNSEKGIITLPTNGKIVTDKQYVKMLEGKINDE